MSKHSSDILLHTFAEYRRQPDFGCHVDEDRDAWLIAPVSTNRDADTVARSNWETVVADLRRIDPHGDTEEDGMTWEIHRFGHWACGWVEVLLVKPGTEAERAAVEWANALADYPVASDEALSRMEWEEAAESWDSYGADDFRRELRRELRDTARAVVEFIADEATDEELRDWMEELYTCEPYHFDCGGCNFPIGRAVANIGRDDLAAFALKIRARVRSAE